MTRQKTARAKLDGAAGAVREGLGLGMTPFEVQLTVQDFVRANRRPAGGHAFNPARKAWTEKVETELAILLEKIR